MQQRTWLGMPIAVGDAIVVGPREDQINQTKNASQFILFAH